jgi:hypothetical protein
MSIQNLLHAKTILREKQIVLTSAGRLGLYFTIFQIIPIVHAAHTSYKPGKGWLCDCTETDEKLADKRLLHPKATRFSTSYLRDPNCAHIIACRRWAEQREMKLP